jgi:phage recombination protein Bet|tara:strand:+ start:4831 stop:5784 length:954 start_codon:yes stop_codon:yes gene_type:complete
MEVAYRDLNDNDIKLTPAVVKKYICNNSAITDSEMAMFLKLCQHQQLNPFLREVYLIKFGNQPASMVTGKETFLKRAKRDPRYAGHECSIEGTVPEMSATAKVYVQGYQVPISCTVFYEEYVGTKRDGTPSSMWANKPRTMLQKVALVQALREAFPDTFGGMYSQEEINSVDSDKLPTANIVIEKQEPEVVESKDAEVVESEVVVEDVKSESTITFDEPKGKQIKRGANTDVELPERPDRPTALPGSCSEQYANYLVQLFRMKIEDKFYLEYLEEYVEQPLEEWSLLSINKIEKLGKDIIQGSVDFDDVFGTHYLSE